MLTPYDIQVMENDVRDIIRMWNMRITVLKPLPKEKQPNWNSLLHEYSGPIQYVQFDNVPMERKDQIITNTYTMDIVNGNGDQKDGYLYFTTSDQNVFIDETCRILYKGFHWQVTKLYPRIGETLISLVKMMGPDETWDKKPIKVIDVADAEHGHMTEDPDPEMGMPDPEPIEEDPDPDMGVDDPPETPPDEDGDDDAKG